MKQDMANDNWKITALRSIEEIEGIRPVWEKMQAEEPYPVINADIDRYLSVLESQKDGNVRPHVILLKHLGRAEAMVIGRVERRRFHCRIGYKTLFKPHLRCLMIVYGGILGQPDDIISAKLVHELIKILYRGEADVVSCNHLVVSNPFEQQMRKVPGIFRRNHFSLIQPHWRMTIPESLEQFLASRSKNTRKDLRSTINSIKKEFHKTLEIRIATMPEEVPQAIKDVMYIHKNTYQNGLAGDFAKTYEDQILFNVAATKGWLRLYILYIDSEPVAFEYILKYHEVCYGEATAYNPKWQKWNVGKFILLKAIEDLCRDNTAKYIDFGFGNAKYKQSYANEVWNEIATTSIFAARFRPVFLNLLLSSVMGLSLGLNYLSGKSGLTRLLKRRWRNLLQVRSAEKGR